MDETRFNRQLLLFGAEGQAAIEKTRVAIVGLGGLGSHVAQQLAFLGTRQFRLIDRDIVTPTSLNRLVGATREDVVAARPKVAVAERVIRSIDPSQEVDVRTLQSSFVTEAGFTDLLEADFIFGCVDRDAARLILTEFCQAYEKPYLDLATDIGGDGDIWYGGRILYSVSGEMCLVCKDMLNEEAIRADFATDTQREAQARIYGVPQEALGRTGPAVVSLNGILASVAVTEFMVEVTGLRRASRSLEYDGRSGKLLVDTTTPKSDCYYCKGLNGQGEAADLERYVREGWGRKL